ncbi:MAG TPA: helix-hairpin-helix domain-containing protein [Phycisphaerales bacterium]|nr:helix-hairpin-helix domain-containing protein [Phycisphaerales bacterium]
MNYDSGDKLEGKQSRGAMGVAVVIAAVGVLAIAWAKRERSVPVDDVAQMQAVSRALPSARVNLNSATVEELSLLPGIGPGLAERIVKHREEHGPFKSIEQLDDVWGIGPSVMGRVRPYVMIGDENDEEDGESQD